MKMSGKLESASWQNSMKIDERKMVKMGMLNTVWDEK